MLSRRILRIKAFKAIYAMAENPGMSLKEAESRLKRSCEATRDLYLFLLSLTSPLTAEAEARIEASRSKFNPTEEERNPNLKFTRNLIAPLFAEDPDFSRIISRRKLSWEPYDAFLRHLYEHIREQEWFRDYLASGPNTLKEDAALWIRIMEELEDNDELQQILEDCAIDWPDDLPYALICCCKTLQACGRGERWAEPPVFRNDADSSFVAAIIRKACRKFDDYGEMLASSTQKWDLGRICTTDLALIFCGLAEAEAFPETQKGIIINEYVEISKYYSTPESHGFVNGLLDSLIDNIKTKDK